MRILFLFRIILFIFINFIYASALGQSIQKSPDFNSTDNNPHPGLFVGMGENYQSGSFYTNVCQCKFDNGKGNDILLGALIEKEIAPSILLGIGVGYNYKSLKSSYSEREMLQFILPETGNNINVPVRFRNEANAKFSYLFLTPYFKWQPADFVFLRMGLNVSYLLSSNLIHTKEILDTSVTLSTGEIVPITFSNGREITTIENNNFPDIKSLAFYIEPSLGFNIKLSKDYIISPIVQLSLPYNKFFGNNDNFCLIGWRILIEIRREYEDNVTN